MSSSYQQLPSKFDYTQYYLNQAAGGPSFPVYRARQAGGSFLAPFVRRHGVPFLKWLGKQAASLASGVGSAYLNKGSISKSEMKDLLKQQGKQAAHSVLDKVKQQVGSGTMTHRRDARLSALIPLTTTQQRDGILTNHHRIRPPIAGEGLASLFPGRHLTGRRKQARKTKTSRRKSKAGARSETNHVRSSLKRGTKRKATKKRGKGKQGIKRGKKGGKKKISGRMMTGKRNKTGKISRGGGKRSVKNPFNHTIFS